ncbi:hypothetical protein L1283_005824 [Sphingobacterium sp. HSC-15S19]
MSSFKLFDFLGLLQSVYTIKNLILEKINLPFLKNY